MTILELRDYLIRIADEGYGDNEIAIRVGADLYKFRTVTGEDIPMMNGSAIRAVVLHVGDKL